MSNNIIKDCIEDFLETKLNTECKLPHNDCIKKHIRQFPPK